MCRGSLSLDRDDRGGNAVTVKITRRQEEHKWFKINADVAIRRIYMLDLKNQENKRSGVEMVKIKKRAT